MGCTFTGSLGQSHGLRSLTAADNGGDVHSHQSAQGQGSRSVCDPEVCPPPAIVTRSLLPADRSIKARRAPGATPVVGVGWASVAASEEPQGEPTSVPGGGSRGVKLMGDKLTGGQAEGERSREKQ